MKSPLANWVRLWPVFLDQPYIEFTHFFYQTCLPLNEKKRNSCLSDDTKSYAAVFTYVLKRFAKFREDRTIASEVTYLLAKTGDKCTQVCICPEFLVALRFAAINQESSK